MSVYTRHEQKSKYTVSLKKSLTTEPIFITLSVNVKSATQFNARKCFSNIGLVLAPQIVPVTV